MTENRENWLYPDASGLYFPHDGFIMRATDGKQYDYEEECELLNEYDKKYNECRNDVLRLEKENEQLKNRVDELEDDNMKYTLSTDKLEGYTKRFMPTKCINEFRDCKTNRYYWLDNEDNFTGALELLNLLDCEIEQLKKELFEARKDYILETYADNPVRRDEKLKALEKELKE